MKRNYLFLIFFLSIKAIPVQSQDSNNFAINFEVGSGIVMGELNKNWNVRQDVGSNYYYSDYNSNSLYTDMTIAYFGIKPEFTFAYNKIGVITGLRFTRINSNMAKYSASEGDYFYLLNKVDGNNTEYFRINNISQDNDYLGFPFEIRYIFYQSRTFGLYFKAGTEINFKLNSKTDIQFLNEPMETYQNEILENVGVTPNPIYSSVYSSIGIKIGKRNRVNYNFEIFLPSYIRTPDNSSIVVPNSYSGFQFSVQVPVK